MTEVEDTFKRLIAMKGVTGAIVMNNEGIPIRTANLDQSQVTCFVANMQQVVAKVNSAVRELDSSNAVTFIRLRTKKHEIMIAPDKEFSLIVTQNPDDVDKHRN